MWIGAVVVKIGFRFEARVCRFEGRLEHLEGCGRREEFLDRLWFIGRGVCVD